MNARFPGPAPLRRPERIRFGAALTALITTLVFSRAITCGFVDYDDGDYVVGNPHVQAGLSWHGVRWAFTTGHAGNWHPLTWLSHMADVSMFGIHPAGHHVTSVLLHAFNAGLLFWLLYQWVGHPIAAGIGALAFALHPLRVESVAWVSERKDVLSLCFGLFTLLAYTRAIREPAGTRRRRFWLLALISYAAGLMSKPTLVSLPFVLLLLDYWPCQRHRQQPTPTAPGPTPAATRPQNLSARWGPLVREKWPFFLLALISCVVTYRVQQAGGAVAPVEALPLHARLENVPVSYARYLLKTVAPVDLAVLYPHPIHWSALTIFASTALCLGLTSVCWFTRRPHPYLWVGWAWFCGTLMPMIGIVQVGIQSMADRYTYFPSVGLSLALAAGLAQTEKLAGRIQRLIGTGSILVLAAGALLTWRQIGYWRTSETLFRRTLAVTRNNELAHNNLGYYYAMQGRWDEAMAQYRAALAIRPQYADALNNLGHALAELGRPAEALPYLETAARLRPGHVGVLNNLGNALAALGRFDEAMATYQTALKSNPTHADTWNNIGVALGMQGQLDEALAHLREAVRLRPRHGPTYSNLGNALAALGRWSEAEEAFRKALSLDPKDPRAWNNLANVLLEMGQLPEAEQAYNRALALEPHNPETLFNLAQLRLRQGRTAEAQTLLREAIRLRPDYPEARAQLRHLDNAHVP